MTPTWRTPQPPSSQDDQLVDRLVEAVGAETASPLELARLRRQVTQARSTGATRLVARTWRGWTTAAAASIAAALSLGALVMTLQLSPDLSSDEQGDVTLARTASGAVQIAFADGRYPHRVARSNDLDFSQQESRVVHSKTFVDRSGAPAPGSVVYYKID